jgi:hypothetical protein
MNTDEHGCSSALVSDCLQMRKAARIRVILQDLHDPQDEESGGKAAN